MSEEKPLVGILMGSDSDYEVMIEAARALKSFDVPFEMTVSSAHRSPERTARYASQARDRGVRVLIVGAGAAAHLAGVVASETTLPVIGVPIDSSALKGLDALLATVQMPGGIPVATVAIGKAGAKNAGILAVQMLATCDARLAARLEEYKRELAAGVEMRAQALKERLARELS
jgi:5-(carboxyamino)imidazole ribonucleotide mutase